MGGEWLPCMSSGSGRGGEGREGRRGCGGGNCVAETSGEGESSGPCAYQGSRPGRRWCDWLWVVSWDDLGGQSLVSAWDFERRSLGHLVCFDDRCGVAHEKVGGSRLLGHF